MTSNRYYFLAQNWFVIKTALRFNGTFKTKKNDWYASLLVIGSTALSLTALILADGIMRGFETSTTKLFSDAYPQIMLSDHAHEELEIEKIKSVIKKEFPEVSALSGYAHQHVGVLDQSKQKLVHTTTLHAVDPLSESLVTKKQEQIITLNEQQPSLTKILSETSIIIGERLAQRLGIGNGDKVTLVSIPIDSIKKRTVILSEATYLITGILKTGIDELDETLMICSYQAFEQLCGPASITEIGLTLNKNVDQEKCKKKLKERFKLAAYSWHDLYPTFIAALKLDRYAVVLIIALMALSSLIASGALIFLHVGYRTRDAALFYALGMSRAKIRFLFMWMAGTPTLIGAFLGVLLAVFLAFLVNTFEIIHLPDIYYISYLPIIINIPFICIILLLPFLVSLTLAFIATQKISSIPTAELLKKLI